MLRNVRTSMLLSFFKKTKESDSGHSCKIKMSTESGSEKFVPVFLVLLKRQRVRDVEHLHN